MKPRIENIETINKFEIPTLPPRLSTKIASEIGAPVTASYFLDRNLSELSGKLSFYNTGDIKPASPGIGADYAVSCHKLVSDGMPVSSLITEIEAPDVLSLEESGRFLNITFDRRMMAPIIIGEIFKLGQQYGHNNKGEGQRVVLDVSSPNVAKQMHLGHLRSTVIGESIRRLYAAHGYDSIADNHLGDWGTQFGILAHAYELWGSEIPELNEEGSQVAGLLKLYVRINQAIAEEKEQSETDESLLENAGRAWFARLEQGDPEARKIWQWTYDLSIKEFEKIYEVLGVDFDFILGESVYAQMSQDMYNALLSEGIAFEDSQGRLLARPSDEKLNDLTIRKSDGSSLYSTRDLSCLLAREAWFSPDEVIYVVGDEQASYFVQVFDIFAQLYGIDKVAKLQHVGFGKITLPEGKMSTRKGNVIFLEDVLTQLKEKAAEKISSNAALKGEEIDAEELTVLSETVAVGAIIYYDLKQSASRRIKFDWQEALDFEGDSGPYLQYTASRMKALLQKGEWLECATDSVDFNLIDSEGPEGDLIMQMAQYPEIVRLAKDRKEPSVIAQFTYQLARTFNRFYTNQDIARESNPDLKKLRLCLTAATLEVMRSSMWLLNIPLPSKM